MATATAAGHTMNTLFKMLRDAGMTPEELPFRCYPIEPEWECLPIIKMVRRWERLTGRKWEATQ